MTNEKELYSLTSAKDNFYDVIQFDDVMFIVNNNEFSKTYFRSIEYHIFFLFTLFHKLLEIKIQNHLHFLSFQYHVSPLDTFWFPSNKRGQLRPELLNWPFNSCRYHSGKFHQHRLMPLWFYAIFQSFCNHEICARLNLPMFPVLVRRGEKS